MTNLFFNSAILSNHSSWLGKEGNERLTSFRYLFHGRTVEVWNHKVIDETPSFSQRHWTKTASAILLLTYEIWLGILLKLLDYALFESTRKDYAAVQKFDEAPYSLDSKISLDLSHARLDKMATLIKNKMTSKEVWQDSIFIEEVSTYMEAAYREVEMLFEQLEERYDADPEKIAKVMAANGLSNPLNEDNDESFYCYYYFYNSLTEIYRLARGCANLEDHPRRKEVKIIHFPSLTEEDQDPYFTPDTPQYRWRTLYNNFCSKLDELSGLRQKLSKEDGRFVNWAEPDEEIVDEKYVFPDTRPTLPSFLFEKY